MPSPFGPTVASSASSTGMPSRIGNRLAQHGAHQFLGAGRSAGGGYGSSRSGA